MSGPLSVLALGAKVYRVTGGTSPHRVTFNPPSCDCGDFQHRGAKRTPPSCKHIAAVTAFRDAEPLADLLDDLTPEQTLDVVDPSQGYGYPPRVRGKIDKADRAVAIKALEVWGEMRRAKPKPEGYMVLWRAACEAVSGLEIEQSAPHRAAEHFATAAGIVRAMAEKQKAGKAGVA